MSPSILFFSLLGGVLPALLWLWFWLMGSFIAGMLAVFFALPLEQWICNRATPNALTGCQDALGNSTSVLFVIIGWAIVEETLKYSAAYLSALRGRENDEPIDSLIYLITAALGFAALENTLFLVGAFNQGGVVHVVDLGVLRFVGATLLHIVTSGALGFFLALGFNRHRHIKRLNLLLGLSAAILLHTFFNIYILKVAGAGNTTLSVFAFVWLAITLLLIGFEKVKQLRA
ncbi:MAG: hypothetical protein Greene041679_528 [Parcubacteria group bacterium Greene0416_79]|nr:MAG: hypothetical protein Greene041679_528 [Parcubacteria group bacterium Greene0416_79]